MRALIPILLILTGLVGAALAAEPSGIEGPWAAEQANAGRPSQPVTLTFTRQEAALSGTMRIGADDLPLFELREAGTTIAFTVVVPGSPYVAIRYAGARAGDEIRMVSGDGAYTLTGRRADIPPQAPAATPPPQIASLVPSPPQPAPQIAPPPPPVTAAPPLPPPIAVAPARPPVAAAPAPPPIATPPGLPPLRDLPPNNLARTPPMGWSSRQRIGTAIDDDTIRQAAEGLDESGLRAAGYVLVEIGDGWQGTRDANGVLAANVNFPDMKALGDYIHGKGLKFGLTLAAGAKSCGGFEGSYGHEVEDARILAGWGVDHVVYDWCGAGMLYPSEAERQAATQKMAEALRATGRDMVFTVGDDGPFNVARWAARAGANLWRSRPALRDDWQAVTEAGMAANGTEPLAGPGRWNDPGLVQAGNGAMNADEYRSQINLWAMLAAPLMLGTDVRIMMRDTVGLLTNAEAIAIDQDTLGRQARRVAQNGEVDVWARPLADGSTAVLFLNRGTASAAAAVSWQQLGIEGVRRVRDLWWHQNLGLANGRYSAFLTGHTSLLLRLSP